MPTPAELAMYQQYAGNDFQNQDWKAILKAIQGFSPDQYDGGMSYGMGTQTGPAIPGSGGWTMDEYQPGGNVLQLIRQATNQAGMGGSNRRFDTIDIDPSTGMPTQQWMQVNDISDNGSLFSNIVPMLGAVLAGGGLTGMFGPGTAGADVAGGGAALNGVGNLDAYVAANAGATGTAGAGTAFTGGLTDLTSALPGTLGSGTAGIIDPTTLQGLLQSYEGIEPSMLGTGLASSGLGADATLGYGLGGSIMAGAPGTLSAASGTGSFLQNLATTMGGTAASTGFLDQLKKLISGNGSRNGTGTGTGSSNGVTINNNSGNGQTNWLNPLAGALALNYAKKNNGFDTSDLSGVLGRAQNLDWSPLTSAITASKGLNTNQLQDVFGRSTNIDTSALQRLQSAGVSTDAIKNVLGNSNVDLSRMKSVYDSLGPNADAFVQSAVDPLQKNIAAGYGDLTQSLSQRGLGGSSFASGALGNYVADTGRTLADASASARQQGLTTMGSLAGNIAGLEQSNIGLKGDLAKSIAGIDLSNLQNQTGIAQLLPQLQLQGLGLQGTLANDIASNARANVGLQGQLGGNLLSLQDQNLSLQGNLAGQLGQLNALKAAQQNSIYGRAFDLIGRGLSGNTGTDLTNSIKNLFGSGTSTIADTDPTMAALAPLLPYANGVLNFADGSGFSKFA